MLWIIASNYVNFPLLQVCDLQLENWEYDISEQRLDIGSPGVIPDSSFKENGEWKLKNTSGCVQIFTGDDARKYSILRVSNLLLMSRQMFNLINKL